MIFNPSVKGGGIKLPALDNPGAAADLLAGKQLVDQYGNLLTGTMPSKSAADLTADGSSIVVPSGYYPSQVSKSVATATQATPSISVSSSGLITASAAQTAGYVAAGTKSATRQLTTQGAQTITPGTSNKTISSGRYLTGTQTIKGDANLVAANIKSGISIFGVAGTAVAPTLWGSRGSLGLSRISITSTKITVDLSGLPITLSKILSFSVLVGVKSSYVTDSDLLGLSYALDNYNNRQFYVINRYNISANISGDDALYDASTKTLTLTKSSTDEISLSSDSRSQTHYCVTGIL